MIMYFFMALCFLPAILCFAGFLFFSKTPFSSLIAASLLGLLAVVPTTFLQTFFAFLSPYAEYSESSGFVRLLIQVILFNGLFEELFKTALIALIPSKRLTFRQFFIVSLLFGISLASFESAVYFLHYLRNAQASGATLLVHLIFLRVFSSDLIHVACAGLCGLFVWSIRAKRADVLALVFAVLVHGVFDFFGYFEGAAHWFLYAAVLFALCECRIHYVRLNPDADDASQNETIIVFEQEPEPGQKKRRLDEGAAIISETKPENSD